MYKWKIKILGTKAFNKLWLKNQQQKKPSCHFICNKLASRLSSAAGVQACQWSPDGDAVNGHVGFCWFSCQREKHMQRPTNTSPSGTDGQTSMFPLLWPQIYWRKTNKPRSLNHILLFAFKSKSGSLKFNKTSFFVDPVLVFSFCAVFLYLMIFWNLAKLKLISDQSNASTHPVVLSPRCELLQPGWLLL